MTWGYRQWKSQPTKESPEQAGASHFILATVNSPWCEIFMPPPGGPEEVYDLYEQEFNLTRGPEGIYMRPPERPGFGFDVRVD